MAEKRRILHIDLDAFYCAVEEQRDPNLKGKPFAVGGRPDQRGVVASCSYAARKYGVRSAMPMAQAVKVCPDLIIVRGNFSDYGEASGNVMDHLRTLTDQVQQISIDEAFLDVTNLPESSQHIAENLQQHINSNFGLPCSIGIAANKLVAKMASDYGKVERGFSDRPPNAIFIVITGQEADFLAPLPVDALWGVGPKTAEKLNEMNINTIGDLTQVPEEQLTKRFGKWGYAIVKRAQGIDESPIVLKHVAKSVSQERTFAEDVRSEDTLIETIEKLSSRISKRLKKKHVQGTTIKIKLRWSDFSTITRQMTIAQPTNDEETISSHATALLKKELKIGEPIRLIGVGVSNLAPEQLNLWDQALKVEKDETAEQLNSAIRALREKFGDEVVKWGEDLPNSKSQ
ncbi:MAG: DNA polymerase IV [Anaerolineales bacterium]|nr:DNA polymerase IV [Anaerolineales bacterium]